MRVQTYRHLLLRQDYGAVLASYTDRCDVCRGDCLECILCDSGSVSGCVQCCREDWMGT